MEEWSEISTHSSIALLASFLGVLPAAGAEQEKDVDSPWDSEVPSLEEAAGPHLTHLLLGSFHSAAASATRS